MAEPMAAQAVCAAGEIDRPSAIRRIILDQSKRANVGHIGSCLCIVEILDALYWHVMNGSTPDDPKRDRFILSKGHAALALYATLALKGDLSREELNTFCTDGSNLGVHPESSVPGIDFSTGSLGQGLSMAAGAALAARMQKSRRSVYCLVSDGECNEGSLWEAAMFAGQHQLRNLHVIVDANGQQAFGLTRDVLDCSKLADRWASFGWRVSKVDGHSVPDLVNELTMPSPSPAPHVVIAKTVFGRGVSFMEQGRPITQAHIPIHPINWHYLPMSDVEYNIALSELGANSRQAFIQAMCRLAEKDPRILLLTGDLGFMAMEPFRERFPNRFINVGVAEQNMIGLATGLAEAGFLPYAYSIATFASLRPLEFIRNGPVLHNLPVRIVGMGTGFEYGHAGPTHYAVEDVAVLRTLPGLMIVVPADSAQTTTAMEKTHKVPGPIYYSLGKDDKASLPPLEGRFDSGRAQILRRGGNIALISMGSVSQEALAAAEILSSRGVETTFALVSTFSPDPVEDLVELLAECRHAITVEAQTISGGLGAFVAGVIATNGLPCRLQTLAVRTPPDGTSGRQPDRWRKHGLDRDSIVSRVLACNGAVRQ